MVGRDVEHRRHPADDDGRRQHCGECTPVAYDGPHDPRSEDRRLKRGIVAEYRVLQALQHLARLDPEFSDEQPSSVAIHLERLGLTAGAIQSEHQLST